MQYKQEKCIQAKINNISGNGCIQRFLRKTKCPKITRADGNQSIQNTKSTHNLQIGSRRLHQCICHANTSKYCPCPKCQDQGYNYSKHCIKCQPELSGLICHPRSACPDILRHDGHHSRGNHRKHNNKNPYICIRSSHRPYRLIIYRRKHQGINHSRKHIQKCFQTNGNKKLR